MLADKDIRCYRDAGNSEEEIRAIILEDQILDESIQKAAYEEWLGVLVSMWDAVDKDVDEKRLMYYAKEFESIPLGLLENSVKRAIRNNGKYLSVPSVGAIWDAIRKETGEHPNMDILEVVQLWKNQVDERFDMHIYRFAAVAVETEPVHASA